jgi:hypothetical protein
MPTLKIYDPAMCCSTGVCGPNVDEKLVHLAGFLKGLDKNDITVERYNLSQQPEAYAANPVVAGILQEKGTDALPLIFVDEKLVGSGDYPPTHELAKLLGVECVNTDDSSDGHAGGCCQ